MDNPDLIQLALETLPWVSVQAICSGVETGDVKAGEVGTELFMVASEIGNSGYQICDRRHEQLEELLHLVDKACSSPSHTNLGNNYPLATLEKIASFKASGSASSMMKLEKDIRRDLGHFFVKSRKVEVPVLLKIIEKLVPMRAKESPDQKADKDTTLLETDPGYPRHVNNALYSQLRMQISCSCQTRHLEKARLRLESGKTNFDEEVIRFELLFCASFSSPGRDLDSDGVLWQETDVFVPRKEDHGDQTKSKKNQRTRFEDEPSHTSSSVPLHSRKLLKTLGPGEFCRSIGKKVGSRLSFKIHDGSLRLLDGRQDPPQRNVKLAEGVSLDKLLDNASYMPKRVKIILAYTIARSVWQYYNSHWMSNPWTHENIHFLEEKDRGRTGYKPHPYFAVHFNNPQTKILDFYTGQDLMFNYPNVLALAILLIEIATGQLFKDICHSCRWDRTQINDSFDWAWTTAAANDLGDTLYNSYADVVKNCLDRDLFRDAPFDEENPENNLETRQSILYSKVVLPLEELVNAYPHDWELHEIHKLPNPQILSTHTIPGLEREPNMITRDPVFLASDVAGTGRWTPEYWLQRIDRINEGLAYLAKHSPAPTPIKIAILDTGCNIGAEYFSSSPDDEERLEGHWKDWVDNEPSPVDQHGHGTALVTLLMRMVRNAEIFVARVARNAEGLHNAEDNIAKAIIHAAEKWDVDIISMSFGFPTEVKSIKTAIRKAEDIKKESIVFFAAAANDGANTQEMFPASMESVISVRATSSNGSFVPTYNPPPSAMKEGSPLFGTLGQNVPYDCSNDLTRSGCSLATPIMAGITALIMEYLTYKSSRFEQSECNQEHIRTKRGVIELFKQIAVEEGNHRFYVAPWNLFEKGEEYRLSIVRIAIGRLPPPQKSRS